MSDFDDDKTKEFERLFTDKDILGLEAFVEKNNYYKKIYNIFKGRFYFDTKNQFSFKISPDQKTAALICMLHEKKSSYNNSDYNLEILIATADAYGEFHRSEQMRYDCDDKMRFAGLENNAVLLTCADNPYQTIRRYLRKAPDYVGLPKMEIIISPSIEDKKQLLITARNKYHENVGHISKRKYPANALEARMAVWNTQKKALLN